MARCNIIVILIELSVFHSQVTPRYYEILQLPCNLADLLISPCLFLYYVQLLFISLNCNNQDTNFLK